jgi:hypothetical protein
LGETAIKERVMAWLRAQGCYVVKMHGDAYQERGILDLFGILPGGRGFILELKVPGQEPSKLQEYHMEQGRKPGGAVGCAHSLEEAQEWFGQVMAEGVTVGS